MPEKQRLARVAFAGKPCRSCKMGVAWTGPVSMSICGSPHAAHDCPVLSLKTPYSLVPECCSEHWYWEQQPSNHAWSLHAVPDGHAHAPSSCTCTVHQQRMRNNTFQNEQFKARFISDHISSTTVLHILHFFKCLALSLHSLAPCILEADKWLL